MDLHSIYTSTSTFLSQFVALNAEELEAIFSSSQLLELKKNDHIIKEGQYCKRLFFLHSGFVRYYHILEGEEKTRDFISYPNFITAYESWISAVPSDVNIQALSDCRALFWQRKDFLTLYEKYPNIHKLARMMSEQAFINLNRQYIRLLKEDALSRYKDLLEKTPGIIHVAPLQQIASFLNITPQHLSRIRKTVSKNN